MPPTATQQQQPHLEHAHAPSTGTLYCNSKNVGGRPTHYTDEKATLICDCLASGQSLVAICKAHNLPYRVVMAWLERDATFQHRYAHARRLAAAWNEQRVVQIALDATPETAQVARLQCDALKWQASKQDPKVYGDRPAEVNINTQVNVTLPEAELRSLQQRKAILLEERQAKAMPAKARLLSI